MKNLTTNHIYYAATNRGFIKARGEFTHNIRLAYPFDNFELAELIAREEIAKGNCRNYYAILQTVASDSNAAGIVDCSAENSPIVKFCPFKQPVAISFAEELDNATR